MLQLHLQNTMYDRGASMKHYIVLMKNGKAQPDILIAQNGKMRELSDFIKELGNDFICMEDSANEAAATCYKINRILASQDNHDTD